MSVPVFSRWLVPVALVSALACANGDDGGSASQTSTSTTGSGSTSTDPSANSTTGSSTSTSTSGLTIGESSSTGEGSTSTSDTSDTSDTEDTEDTSCTPGELDCACAEGSSCDGDLICVEDLCAWALECAGDDQEPNEDEATAIDLGTITDDDDDISDFSGVLSGSSDVDWYRFIGKDTAFHTTEPTTILETSEGLRFCVFLDCIEDGPALTEVSCPDGTDFAISPGLRPGCCSSAGFEFADYNCPGGDDSLLVFMRLDKPIFDECVDYSGSYFL